MADSNITIAGNVGGEPELRYTNGGKAVISLSVGVNHSFKRGDEWVNEDTTWYQVTVWGDVAENVAASVTKGTRIIATGRLHLEKYERLDGGEGFTLKLDAFEIGVSLKSARCEVERIARERSDDQGSYDSTNSRKRQETTPVYGETEPFLDVGDRGDLTYRDMHLWV